MSFNARYDAVRTKNGSRLCVGLDTDPAWIPEHLRDAPNPQAAFNRAIIEATSDLCVAYKMNLAFYESNGSAGHAALEETLDAIPEGILTIGDAKRGDIGNTAAHYSRAMFETWGFDATTVSPYMGTDTIATYFDHGSRCVFVLALTSNPGSSKFQRIADENGTLYERVIDACLEEFGDADQLGFVVGATHPDELAAVRGRVGADTPLLIPGIGAQGGDAEATVRANAGGIGFINVSRGISKASSGEDFAEAARAAALEFRDALASADPVLG